MHFGEIPREPGSTWIEFAGLEFLVTVVSIGDTAQECTRNQSSRILSKFTRTFVVPLQVMTR